MLARMALDLANSARTYSYTALVWSSVHCESKMKKKIYKLRKVDNTIPIPQLARSSRKNTKKPGYQSRKMVLNQAQDQTEK